MEEAYKKLRIMWPTTFWKKGLIVLHDNARPHTSFLTQRKMNELGVEELHYPPYSPDLSATDCYLFRELAAFLRQKKYADDSAVKNGFRAFQLTHPED
ncbi:hypothetical protein M514_07827 [Trichuris suis]|uniref:Tc1-like transposase DDE domain-containing protein n=1 Tax=Trichuris suis TaxID=68888 RepID=A0A085N5E2_9BILA|nr:hypothetical protein M513_07827 [Trichuris suis]KFD64688.1 hypothetical protein M514_07827 [Trichuris suis]